MSATAPVSAFYTALPESPIYHDACGPTVNKRDSSEEARFRLTLVRVVALIPHSGKRQKRILTVWVLVNKLGMAQPEVGPADLFFSRHHTAGKQPHSASESQSSK